ncbi:MAG: hypothetical protein OMM_08020 [Candidatus Magnetoglobus multicellularis str. Araruama]|uniref:Uncharacterized protein n=1 Tax=Candidatus Magnetoglobus multicellularis str. Araruama TaxID=890399 RepID=A0A1V1P9L0_9BACT|nr:MAG: hypothetical protein OMM_08020 [Candidatus Magnetoglobus multicellularis str. Araruama]
MVGKLHWKSLNIPEDILYTLNETRNNFVKKMRLYSAMALYKARKLSMGKASELAEMNKINFMCELGKYDIPAINYDVDEFKEELEWIKTKEGYNHNPNKKIQISLSCF